MESNTGTQSDYVKSFQSFLIWFSSFVHFHALPRMWEQFSSPSSLCSMNPTHFLPQMLMLASCIADGVTPMDAIMSIQILLGKTPCRAQVCWRLRSMNSIHNDWTKFSSSSLTLVSTQHIARYISETKFIDRVSSSLASSSSFMRCIYVCWWWFDLYRKLDNRKQALQSKVEAEKEGIVVPLTLEEYCLKPKINTNNQEPQVSWTTKLLSSCELDY